LYILLYKFLLSNFVQGWQYDTVCTYMTVVMVECCSLWTGKFVRRSHWQRQWIVRAYRQCRLATLPYSRINDNKSIGLNRSRSEMPATYVGVQSTAQVRGATGYFQLLGCIECIRCRLLLPMCSMSVCQSVYLSVCLSRGSTRLHCAGVIRCSLYKLLWPHLLDG